MALAQSRGLGGMLPSLAPGGGEETAVEMDDLSVTAPDPSSPVMKAASSCPTPSTPGEFGGFVSATRQLDDERREDEPNSMPSIVVPMVISSPSLPELTPAVHADSTSSGGCFSPVHSVPTMDILPTPIPSPSVSPAPFGTDVPAARIETPVPVLSAVGAPMSLSSSGGALPPPHHGHAHSSSVDIPLDYSSQYSPSAASRRLAPPADRRVHSRSASPHGGRSGPDLSSASAGSVAASSALAPSPVPQRSSSGFFSALFGWSSGATARANPAQPTPVPASSSSVSLPVTPDPATHVAAPPAHAHPQFPHTTTNAQQTQRGHNKSISTSSFGDSSSRGGLSASASHPSLASAARTGSGSRRVTLQAVTAHPLLVHPLVSLTAMERREVSAYSTRLKASLSLHEARIAKLQALKKRHQASRTAETMLWHKFAVSSLVSIAASLYHTRLLHCSARLQLEFGFTGELARHLNRVQLVLDARLPLATLLDEVDRAHAAHVEEELHALADNPAPTDAEVEIKAKSLHQTRADREAIQNEAERTRAEAQNAAALSPISNREALATIAASAASASLRARFLSRDEIEAIFLGGSGGEAALLGEQVSSLGETAAKLQATYRDMQRKALCAQPQGDTKQARTLRLHALLQRALDSAARDEPLARGGEMLLLRMDAATCEAQASFDTMLLDQRAEEGKLVAKFLAEAAHPPPSATGAGAPVHERKTPEAMLAFVDLVAGDLTRRYDLIAMQREREKEVAQEAQRVAASISASTSAATSNNVEHEHEHEPAREVVHFTVNEALHLFLHRLLFPQLRSAVRLLRSEQEADLDQWYQRKLAWIVTLTKAQLGLNHLFLPPGTDLQEQHKHEWMPADDLPAPEEEEVDEDDLDALELSDTVGQSTASTVAANEPPYLSAMRILHRLNSATASSAAPIDLLYLVIRALREVTRLANGYLEMHRAIERAAALESPLPLPSSASPACSTHLHADNMFPLVLYVVIHSGLAHPHTALGVMARFLPPERRHFGTGGYALAMFESAVSHVDDLSRDQLQSAGPTTSTASSVASDSRGPSPPKGTRKNSRLEGTPPLPSPARTAAATLTPPTLPPPALGDGDDEGPSIFNSPSPSSSSAAQCARSLDAAFQPMVDATDERMLDAEADSSQLQSAPPSLPPSQLSSPAAVVGVSTLRSIELDSPQLHTLPPPRSRSPSPMQRAPALPTSSPASPEVAITATTSSTSA